MHILVVGVGGIGGYFGGRLVEKGEDVTFLVRKRRKEQLEKKGHLMIHSVNGDLKVKPALITASDPSSPFDLILLSTKAYHLQDSIKDIKPFVGENTVILPLLNGIAHVPLLIKEFGEEKVIGGLCFIETTLNSNGEIVQASPVNRIVIGDFNEPDSERIHRIASVLSGTRATFELSDHIEQEMWHKYLFITVMSGMTALMSAPVGPIRDSEGGRIYIRQLFEEVEKIMKAHNAPIREGIVDEYMEMMDNMSYDMKSSMQRDMEKESLIEGDHLQGYLLNLAEKYNINAPLLKTIYQHLKVYEKVIEDKQFQTK
ncbi:ketopantoate reductase family protein [bacterium LRH843]|nr:ketopantoate reductase family protein [bacterium LRH843]